MVEINNQGINNYMAQQTAPQVAEQATTQTSQVQEKQIVKNKEESKIEQRGVILEISQEARKLSKADLNEDALEAFMMNRRSRANLHAAIMEAKQYQDNVSEKISDMIDAVKADKVEENTGEALVA